MRDDVERLLAPLDARGRLMVMRKFLAQLSLENKNAANYSRYQHVVRRSEQKRVYYTHQSMLIGEKLYKMCKKPTQGGTP